MVFYHRTTEKAAAKILKGGFRDGQGRYMTTVTLQGVWVSDVPLDSNEGAKGHTLLKVSIPIAIIGSYEVVEEGKPYREWVVPAAILNENGKTQVV
jgi:hypothetical protein